MIKEYKEHDQEKSNSIKMKNFKNKMKINYMITIYTKNKII